ncbi:hypothetical protein AWZ03_012018 [Drosophila navojoa]|uniref:Uncharacterized protein n=1 Tax=Drosophila navojoa TaxID=7232 RepID=A0A484AYW4_DRONA|nr:hypothetical protein AWZ03_012018 [Drosophila navojoa]
MLGCGGLPNSYRLAHTLKKPIQYSLATHRLRHLKCLENTPKYSNYKQIHTMGSMLCKEYKTTGKITPNPDHNSGIIRLKNEFKAN